MIGVTIGIGEGWYECAKWAVQRMEEMTGLQCEVLKGVGDQIHASWFKHRLIHLYPYRNEYLYFDADIICLKPWNPKEIFEKNGRKICAVRDNNPHMANAVLAEERDIGIPHGTYLNAGLFMFGREHAPVFETTWARRPQWHSWIDQSAWNRALFDLKVPVAVLPNEFNRMDCKATGRTVNVHCHSLNGGWQKLKEWQDFFAQTEIIREGEHTTPPASVAPTT